MIFRARVIHQSFEFTEYCLLVFFGMQERKENY